MTAVELREAAAAKFKEASEFAKERGIEDASDSNVSAEDWQQFNGLMDEAKTLDAEYAKAKAKTDTVETLRDRMSYYHEAATGQRMGWQPIGTGEREVRPKTMGEEFVEHEAYAQLLKSGVLNSDNQPFKSMGVQMKAASDSINTVVGQGIAEGLVTPDYLPGILGLPQRDLTIRDLFGSGRTASDLLSYAAQVGFDNAAAAVAQAYGSGSSPTGGDKPQSSIRWQRRTAPVETIATWMAATRQSLADAGQVQALIDNQGRLMLQLEEEDQLLSGNGSSPNLQGLQSIPDVQTLDLTGVDNLDGVRQAINMVKTGLSRLNADSIVLHPSDSMSLDLDKDDNGLYRGGNPIGNFNFGQSVWRLRRVESEGVSEGTAIVGAFRAGATVFERQGITVYTTDSHADFFVKNLVVILFEERIAFPVYYPSAFVIITLSDWATSGGAESIVSP